MTSREPLAVFDLDGPGDRIVLQTPGFADLFVGRRDGLLHARATFDSVMEHFRSLIAVERPGIDQLSTALTYLEGELTQVAFQLVDDDADVLEEIRCRLTRRWPQWQRADAVPVIEVRGHDDHFPFEALPLLDHTPFARFENLTEATTMLRRFVGFTMAVRRVGPGMVHNDPLRAAPVLPVQLITYTMEGVRTEATAFGMQHGRMSVDGPWPSPAHDPADVTRLLLDALHDPVNGLNGNHAGTAAQIQHFACHFVTENRTDSGYALRIGSPGHRHDISLAAIRSGYATRTQQHGVSTESRALIVVNACGSAKVDSGSHRSFARYFLKNRHRGFVGTEADVPDPVAAAFAERFYANLLQGRPLGEAVVRARRELFQLWHNPLGLLYVCYGDPTLAVETV
ncbi:hypothetical protein ACTI_74160 [Actinoplanes sp. OR16]|uniref:CHAT domain-containing protein n=1 Tax=Actinoplanes sp. OR16 TaxID=946334 RepID=UPI000F6FD4F1|nr:CHAT domain-containing protein [Actinoplanes sp. OR16]BBH70731.1 hypothetical protein ACTI_74160 [Actinoplanes sp. OR16]